MKHDFCRTDLLGSGGSGALSPPDRPAANRSFRHQCDLRWMCRITYPC